MDIAGYVSTFVGNSPDMRFIMRTSVSFRTASQGTKCKRPASRRSFCQLKIVLSHIRHISITYNYVLIISSIYKKLLRYNCYPSHIRHILNYMFAMPKMECNLQISLTYSHCHLLSVTLHQ